MVSHVLAPACALAQINLPEYHDIEPRRPARYPQRALLARETRRAEGVSTVATVPSSVRFISRHGLWTLHYRTVLPDEYDVAR